MKTYLKQTSEYSDKVTYTAYDYNKLTSVFVDNFSKNVYLCKYEDLAELICSINDDLNENNAEVITRDEFNEAAKAFSTMYNDIIKEF